MAKFEYTTTPSIGTDLNRMGIDGWELAGSDNSSMFWKRALPETDTIQHKMLASMEAIREHMMSGAAKPQSDPEHQLSDAQRNAAAGAGDKPKAAPQPADRPIGKNEPAPRPESTARTEATAKAGSGGTAEALPRGHTPPSASRGESDDVR